MDDSEVGGCPRDDEVRADCVCWFLGERSLERGFCCSGVGVVLNLSFPTLGEGALES